jgi:uncharacterized integral membrane protein (TIGR00697 family)
MILVNINIINHQFYVTGGIFFIPIVFFVQDIVTEIYGYYNARKMLLTTIFVFIVYVFTVYLIGLLPCKNNDSLCQSFFLIAQTLPRHALSFVISLAVGGTVNNYVLAKLRIAFDRKFLALRFISSTAIGEAIFQIIAVMISWYGTYSIKDTLPLALAAYIYKILFEIFVTPVNLYACRYLKSIQAEETKNAF